MSKGFGSELQLQMSAISRNIQIATKLEPLVSTFSTFFFYWVHSSNFLLRLLPHVRNIINNLMKFIRIFSRMNMGQDHINERDTSTALTYLLH